jgi:hypothetical protein
MKGWQDDYKKLVIDSIETLAKMANEMANGT